MKTIVITGVSSGIGKATALYMASKGYLVFGGARRTELLKELPNEIKTKYLDVNDSKSCEEFISWVLDNTKSINVLVNNAGYGHYGSFEDTTLNEGIDMFNTNLFGVVRMSKLVLETMKSNKKGKIINISSIGGKFVMPMCSWYQSTKHALEAISDGMRLELEDYGIKVCIVEPGAINTEFNDVAIKALRDISGKTEYRKKANNLIQMMEENKDNSSSPLLIAKKIYDICEICNPNPRYALGKHSFSILMQKKILPDTVFDKLAKKRTIYKEEKDS